MEVSAELFSRHAERMAAEALADTRVVVINSSHQCFMNGPSYRPNKSPGRVVPTGNTSGK